MKHAPLTKAEAKAREENPDGCRYCLLDKSAWAQHPRCELAEPDVRPIVGHVLKEKKDAFDGPGAWTMQARMISEESDRYGQRQRSLNVRDLAALERCLDPEQAELLRQIREVAK